MLTNKNWALKAFSTIRWVIAVCGVFLLVGCQPPGPKSLLLGQKYLEQGNYDKALKYLTRASELIPAHPQVWNHLGLAYHAVNEPAKASDAYQRAIRIDRNLPAPHYNLGTLLLEQQHLPQALSELSAFVTLQTNSAAGWTKLGTALVRLNRPDDAERALAQALRIDPRDAEAYNSLGLAHIQRKRPREAMLAFNSALQHREGYPAALLNQAIIAHQHFGNKQLALDRYKAYLTTKPDPKSAAQVQLTVASIEKELSGVEVAQAAPPAPEEASPFSNFLRTNSNSKTAEAATNKPVAAPVTNAVAARQTKTNPPVVANLATNRPLAIAAATNTAPKRQATNLVATTTNAPVVSTTNAPVLYAKANPETAPVEPKPAPEEPKTVASEPKTDTKTIDAEPAAAESEEPPVSVEVVKLEEELVVKPIADLSEVKAATTSQPAALNNPEPKPLFLPRRDRKQEEKPGLLSRVNPVRWFKEGDKPAEKTAEKPADKPEPQLMARHESTPPTRPSYPPVIKSTDPKPEPPRIIPRYQYRRNVPLVAGNRAAAQKVFQKGAEAHQARRLADAMEAYENASTIDPTYFEAHYNLGVAAFQGKNLPMALAASELAVASKPLSRDARFNFALTLREANYPVDAANELRTILNESQEEIRAHFALANIYAQQLDQPALARKHYLAVLELNPNHPEAPAIRSWLASNQ